MLGFFKEFSLYFCLQPSSKLLGQNIFIIHFSLKMLMHLYLHLIFKCQALLLLRCHIVECG